MFRKFTWPLWHSNFTYTPGGKNKIGAYKGNDSFNIITWTRNAPFSKVHFAWALLDYSRIRGMLLPVVNMIVCFDNRLSYILNSSVVILASLVNSHIAYLSVSFFFILFCSLNYIVSFPFPLFPFFFTFYSYSLSFRRLSYHHLLCLPFLDLLFLFIAYSVLFFFLKFFTFPWLTFPYFFIVSVFYFLFIISSFVLYLTCSSLPFHLLPSLFPTYSVHFFFTFTLFPFSISSVPFFVLMVCGLDQISKFHHYSFISLKRLSF